MIEKTREIFDDWARRGRDEGMETGHLPRAEQALEMIPLEPGDRALDLGCGNGWATRWLRACLGDAGEAVGVDIAPEMIAKAKALSQGREGIDFVEAAFEELPFEDGAFDHAFSMEALYYAEDLERALVEIARVLAPGGTLCFCTDFYRENPHCHGWPEMMGIPMELLSEAEWRACFEKAGFEFVESLRCLDPRPVAADLPADEREAQREFREEIGALAILVRKP